MAPTSSSHDRPFYVEPERHDGLSTGVADIAQPEARRERKEGGRGIQPGATDIPARGGRSRKGRTKATHEIALTQLSEPLKRRARFMRKRTCAELAANVGAGQCGIIASALVKLASEDMALREAALEAGDVDLARKLGESCRMHLLYGREIVAKDAAARAKDMPPVDPMVHIRRLAEGGPT